MKKSKGSDLSLVHVAANVKDEAAKEWADGLMELAYSGVSVHSICPMLYLMTLPGVTPKRKLKVFVNPHSGPVRFLVCRSATP